MPVSNTNTYTVSTANGVTTVFPYNFTLLSAGDLVVTVAGVVVTTGFTVSGVGDAAGGNITFSVAPANGAIVLRERVVALTRSTDYQYVGSLSSEVLDADFDRIWLALQRANREASRALKLPLGHAGSAEVPALVANAYPRANSAGTGIEWVPGPEISGTTQSNLVDFLQSGAGAVGRTAQAKMRDRLCIFDFMTTAQIADVQSGAAVLDHTAAMDAALNEAVARKGILYLPAGRYKISSSLSIPSNVTLFGDDDKTEIWLASGSNSHMLTNSDTAGGNSNIVIRNLKLNGNVANQTNNGANNKSGINFNNVTNLTIEGVEVANVGTNCITAINCPGAVVTRNHLWGAYNHAMACALSDGIEFSFNRVHDCGSKTDSTGFSSSGHAFIDTSPGASKNVSVIGNYVYDMGDSCLRNELGGEGWVIANNRIIRSGKDSIKIMGDTVGSSRTLTLSNTTNFVVNDTVTGGSSTATATVTAVDAGAGTVTVTLPSAGTYKTFWLYETLTSSSGGSATINDIVSVRAKANIISNNVIIDAGNNGIVANGSAPCVITGNVIMRSGFNTSGEASGKWFASASGISVTDNSRDVQISGNFVQGAYAHGIVLIDAINPIVRGNTCYQNGDNGILFDRCDRITADSNVCYNNSQRTTATYAGIFVTYTTAAGSAWGRHSITNNRCYDSTGTKQKWGLRLEQGSGTVSNSLVKNNDMWGNTSGPVFINWAGTNNKVSQNAGYITENSGTATMPSGSTLISVTHGLSVTPTADKIKLTPTNNLGNATKYWIGSTSSSTFQIYVDINPAGSGATFAWSVG